MSSQEIKEYNRNELTHEELSSYGMNMSEYKGMNLTRYKLETMNKKELDNKLADYVYMEQLREQEEAEQYLIDAIKEEEEKKNITKRTN